MGHKTNPKILRIGTTQTWPSRWFARKEFPRLLKEDIQMKRYLKAKLREGLLSNIEIERQTNTINIIISAAKPGLIIGRAGAGAEELKKELQALFLKGRKVALSLNIQEVRRPYLNAPIVLQNMIFDIEKRVAFRRVMKQSISRVMKEGAQGVRITISGRLNGAEIARTETLAEGKVPLHTLRADIDYARGAAFTTYGAVGMKVWIYRGEIFKDKKAVEALPVAGSVAQKKA